MLIKSFGLFWRADEIDWRPGAGNPFRVIGRQGRQLPGLQLCDFRDQRGIYILYGRYGPYYVGLNRKQGLGDRLRQHQNDHHSDRWERFSWFGFRQVLKSRNPDGLQRLRDMRNSLQLGNPDKVIGDLEAMLIHALGTYSNINKSKFARATEWKQVPRDELDPYLAKLAKRR
jgi:hypothetical protein